MHTQWQKNRYDFKDVLKAKQPEAIRISEQNVEVIKNFENGQ